jgi:hypothetical protein
MAVFASNGISASYYRPLQLNQLFEACTANLSLIQNTIDPDSEILLRRLDTLCLTLEAVRHDFWDHGSPPDPVMHLLLQMLQKVYNSLIHYADKEHLLVSTELDEGIPTSDSLLLKLFPRDQVRESLEILISALEVSKDEQERIEEYVYRISVRIGRASRHFENEFQKELTVLEMWTDHLLALDLFTYARSMNGSTTAVKFALSEVTRLLSLKELRYPFRVFTGAKNTQVSK